MRLKGRLIPKSDSHIRDILSPHSKHISNPLKALTKLRFVVFRLTIIPWLRLVAIHLHLAQ